MVTRLTWENFQGEYFEAGDNDGSGHANGDGVLDDYGPGTMFYGIRKPIEWMEDGYGWGENGQKMEWMMDHCLVGTSFAHNDPSHPTKADFVSYLNNLIAEAEKLKDEQEIVLVEQIKNTFISMFGNK